MTIIERASRAANPEMYRDEPKPPRKHRGRRLAFPAAVMAPEMAKAPTLSFRSIQNRCYAANALRVLRVEGGESLDARYAWLVSADGTVHRPTLIAELGRVKDPATLRRHATWLCERRPNAHVGVAQLRSWRLGPDAKTAHSGELARRLVATVNAYAAMRAKCTAKLMRHALAIVAQGIDAAELEQNNPNAGGIAGGD